MMPVVSHTQITVPTQVSFVATPMPGTTALRVAPDAVAPSTSDAAITPDGKGSGAYASAPAVASLPQSVAPPVLSVLMPASLGTASASLSAGAMFATQLLAQDAASGSEYLAAYEAFAEAGQVKYKPSNATLPQPAPNNLFARMIAEVQNQAPTAHAAQLQAAVKEAVQHAAPQAPAAAPKVAAPPKAKTQESLPVASRHAAHAYQSVSVHNDLLLDEVKPVEAVAAT